MAHYAARVDATHLEDRLTFKWLIIIRIINPMIMYFFISVCSVLLAAFSLFNGYHGQCFYSLLSVAFQVPFNRLYVPSKGYLLLVLTVMTSATVVRAL
jgi:hypothetical protein